MNPCTFHQRLLVQFTKTVGKQKQNLGSVVSRALIMASSASQQISLPDLGVFSRVSLQAVSAPLMPQRATGAAIPGELGAAGG